MPVDFFDVERLMRADQPGLHRERAGAKTSQELLFIACSQQFDVAFRSVLALLLMRLRSDRKVGRPRDSGAFGVARMYGNSRCRQLV